MGSKSRIVNKRAKFEYEITDKLEAGIVLEGREVKSLRSGRGSLVGAFVKVRDGEVFLQNANIPGYEFADLSDYEPTRTRKLLMHKKEIGSLEKKAESSRLVLVPLELYPSGRRFKVMVGVGRGRKAHQKRAVLKKRDLDREARRELKERGR